MSPKWFLIVLFLCSFDDGALAAIVGTNTPALSLTAERIAALSKSEQAPWKKYLQQSERQWKADQAELSKELRHLKMTQPVVPPHGYSASSIPLRRGAEWYATSNAQRIADIVISFQTPAGGWSKNLNMAGHPRAPGEHFATDNLTPLPTPADFDAPRDTNWNYVGTFDNDATITEMRFLAKVISARGANNDALYRKSFLRGMDYIFASQYPNGGWPQVWPLQGGYHDAITFNDDAVLNIMKLLDDTSSGTNEYSFVPAKTRVRAAKNLQRAIQCVLATQIVANDRRTVWCQQHDPLTLEPSSGRNYEMPSECAAESARLMMFLMRQPKPDAQTVAAIRAAAAWFQKTALRDIAFRRDDDGGRKRVSAPGAGPVWARYYEIGTDRPIFGDRDKTIRDDVNEISLERRRGYGWYNTDPESALEQFTIWSKEHP